MNPAAVSDPALAWSPVTDPASGNAYWWNTVTNEVTYSGAPKPFGATLATSPNYAAVAALTKRAVSCKATKIAIGGPQVAEVASPRSSETDDVPDLSTALPRTQLVALLFDKVVNGGSRFIHLAAPAASGKTSLLQLFQRYAAERGVTSIYMSMRVEDVASVMVAKTGINPGTWRLKPDAAGRCVCADASQQFVVLLDDAQHTYDDVDLWASLIKTTNAFSALPRNIRFVISATYSLQTHTSVMVDFTMLPKLVRADFLLSAEEVDEFLRRASVRLGADKRVAALLVAPEIRQVLATHCNGHVGSLAVSVREIVQHFQHHPVAAVTVADVVSFYLSDAMSPSFAQCFRCDVDALPERMRASLVSSLTAGPLRVATDENPAVYRTLVRSGVLVETEYRLATAASPAAASYINRLLFPRRRAVTSTDEVRQRGVVGLMKAVLARMSGAALRQSAVRAKTETPSEAEVQHLLRVALEAETPASCSICPNLSTYFPPPPSQAMDEDRAAPQPEVVPGRCEFYLHGDLRWAVEVLIAGHGGGGGGGGEHVSRLLGPSQYVGLACTDFLVVDVHVNATGEPTEVHRHERRMSVFFPRDDFSFCTVLCGLETAAETITLAD
eukprot:gene8079-5817_t